MKFSTIVRLLIVLILFSGSQRPSKSVAQNEEPNQHLGSKSGLLFERGMNRGSGYIDSLGTDYSLRYAPIFITNDSTIPIRVELAFLKEYNYSVANGDVKFKIIALPKEWAENGATDSMLDSMYKKLPNYIDKPFLHETIKPGEKIGLAIGTLVIRPREISINLNVPFAHTEDGIFTTCDWQMDKDPTSNAKIALGLKLVINEICSVIPCGQISYPDH